ncbi:DUF2806 domain-containing protein [Sphingomonas sp. SUN039]|uniref:DUF2806 domain-containing protein n=1 Tax=Sphingomonas sp. SUN039 TaxID=2937787 RepID=UPI002164B186|nr:DUF2806 domain-containing protein [Sphingomonas sp. SUN039]UVO55222.1 DUF2806 domain-containing protein [Sphingomonas sp. SUN039]
MSEGSLINLNLGALAKPVEILIERVSDAVGGIARPWQIERIARAEGRADIARAEARIEVTEVEQRAIQRLVKEEGRRQENIESITAQATEFVSESARPQDIEEDWLTEFFARCRNVSDSEMQRIWSAILAGEANHPGSYNKKTIDLLSTLGRTEAANFQKLTRFCFSIGNRLMVFVDDLENPIFGKNGIDFEYLSDLSDLGLLDFNHIAGFEVNAKTQEIPMTYSNRLVIVTLNSEKKIQMGQVRLTIAGSQIMAMCSLVYDQEVLDYILDKWRAGGATVGNFI